MAEMKSLTLNDKTYDGFVDPVARALAAASAVIKPAFGESISLSDTGDNQLYGLNIYGRTIQNGTPTPDSPVELESVGDQGGIIVTITGESDSQDMFLETPNGLPGIPVASGGNYTDANGQQWICDEIDLARGVYVRRIHVLNLDGSEQWLEYKYEPQYYGFFVDNILETKQNRASGMCNQFSVGSLKDDSVWIGVGNTALYAITSEWHNKGTSAWKSYLSTHPLRVIYSRDNPIEIPLSVEEIATYNALRTYRDHTTISNDASAYMELEYAMDTKKYIDSLIISSGGAVARLSNVTLRASAWAGSDSLYSQVVTITGVTSSSKVDLLPSVEQLAIFHNKDVAFVTENEDGVVTVYAIGDKPTQDYTMQVSITEVVA